MPPSSRLTPAGEPWLSNPVQYRIVPLDAALAPPRPPIGRPVRGHHPVTRPQTGEDTPPFGILLLLVLTGLRRCGAGCAPEALAFMRGAR